MGNLKHLDMMSLDDIFEMNGGYVLNFSDRTIAIFFKESSGLTSTTKVFKAHGTSKGRDCAVCFSLWMLPQRCVCSEPYGIIARLCACAQIVKTRSTMLKAG